MSYFSWIKNTYSYITSFFKEDDIKIILLGLDSAGKTSLLYMLKYNKLSINQPTGHPQQEEVVVDDRNIQVFDLGGHASARKLWKQYLFNIDAIVYIVDSSDILRIEECKQELYSILLDESLPAKIPILLLGNKIDKAEACTQQDLIDLLYLKNILTGKEKHKCNANTKEYRRPCELFMCSIVKRIGYLQGFQWLLRHISTK